MTKENKIKSAVELALERTRGMKASPEEISALQQKELEARAKGLAAKYIDGEKTIKALNRELDEIEEGGGNKLKSAVLKELLSFIELGSDCTRAIEGIEALSGPEVKPEMVKLEQLFTVYEQQYAQRRQQRSSQLLEELKERKVHGSAVIPNLLVDELWQTTSEELLTSHENELDNLLAALGKKLTK